MAAEVVPSDTGVSLIIPIIVPNIVLDVTSTQNIVSGTLLSYPTSLSLKHYDGKNFGAVIMPICQ